MPPGSTKLLPPVPARLLGQFQDWAFALMLLLLPPHRRSAAHTSARIVGQSGQQQDSAKAGPVEQTTGAGSAPAPAPAGAADGMDGDVEWFPGTCTCESIQLVQ